MMTNKQMTLASMLIALNLGIGGIVHIMKLPIYLDAIGTILATAILGLVPGVIVGVVSFLLAAVIINPVYVYFIGTQAVIACFVYLLATKMAGLKSVWRVVPWGLALGVVACIVSSPVIVFVFKGVAGSGRDLITASLIATGKQIYKAVLMSGVASEPIDKLLQLLAAFYILRSLPKRLLSQYRNTLLEKNGFV